MPFRRYASYVKIKPGHYLMTDSGFKCLNCHSVHLVKGDEDGDLYVDCIKGKHYLTQDISPGGDLVGYFTCTGLQ